ncbi:endothelin-converting enzyme, Metallo peptidase, MEROPS family M13 [Corchorus olitorius]|uniref:Endothelin-converting enzyme, Metallo peptidase, MEROPS family M13 n=1 Tax=Corchorus olitorius TaxID=93759 RepID=A0A1R3KEY5_9ROSI|nr:endothelin-converting enzyme, Metallo peptidase, MEROPS family M13 [Corchorus olitorius]
MASVKILCTREYSLWRFVELSRFGQNMRRDIWEMKPETTNALLFVSRIVTGFSNDIPKHLLARRLVFYKSMLVPIPKHTTCGNL